MANQKISFNRGYLKARQEAYPPYGDQLDAAMKLLEKILALPAMATIASSAEGQQFKTAMDSIKAVKNKFPKS